MSGARSELAEALRKAAHVCDWSVPCPCVDWPDEQYDATVHATAVSAGHVDEVQGIPEAFADALIPVVQLLAAKELRAVASALSHPREAAWVRARADALAGPDEAAEEA